MTEQRVESDERDIPVVDPSVVPEITLDGPHGWRAALDEVREEHEFFRLGDDPMIWFTRYEAARDLFTNWELFSSVKGPHSPFYATPNDDDPPKALQMRRAMMPMYSQTTVDRWGPRIRDRARELVTSFAEAGEVDFCSRFSSKFFPYVAAEWIGAPADERAQLMEWDYKVFRVPYDPDAPNEPTKGDHRELMAKETIDNIVGYCEELVERKRTEPDDSLASFVTRIEIDGKPISKRDQVALVVMAAFGSGHTVSAHLNYVFYHLATHPGDRQALVDDPGLIDSASEELLRLYFPGGVMRTATRDAEFHGCPIKKGDPVMVMYMQANRDPRAEFGATVSLDRNPNPHLGWLVGVHRCAGMAFARTAHRVAIEEWHRLIPEYRLNDEEPLVEQIYASHGFHKLPLVWDA